MLDILTFFVFFTLACKLEISVVITKNQHWIGFQYRTLYISYAEPADFFYLTLREAKNHGFSWFGLVSRGFVLEMC